MSHSKDCAYEKDQTEECNCGAGETLQPASDLLRLSGGVMDSEPEYSEIEIAYMEFESKEARLLDHWLAPIVARKAFDAGYAAGQKRLCGI